MSNEGIQPAASLPNEIRDLEREYRGTGIMAPVFWGPCLKHCVKYQRVTCYFTSKGLLGWTQALPGLIRGELELIQLVFCKLNDQRDLEAIKKSLDPEAARRLREEKIEEILNLAIFNEDADQNTAKRQKVLAWLIANNKLELRFAVPKTIADNPYALMHEKGGVFYFKDGDQVSFMGSPNETQMAGSENHEAALVFKSWVDKERVEDAKLSFIETWENKSSSLEVTELSQEMLDRIKVVAPPDCPTIDEESDESPPEPEEPAGWPHKEEAVDAWFNNNHAGILEMATGTGKTSTAFLIIKRLLKEKTIDRIILTMKGKDLLNQWYEDLLKQKITEKDSPFRRILRQYGNHHGLNKFVTDSQHATLLISRPQLKDVFTGLEKRGELATTLIVHDEVHELGSASHRKELAGKHQLCGARLGLSATPERLYDTEGSKFIIEEIGKVVFTFSLQNAIERGVLCEFDYAPLEYELTANDHAYRQKIRGKIYAAEKKGDPIKKEMQWIMLSKVHKLAEMKPKVFADHLENSPDSVRSTIVFVEEREEQGEEVLAVIAEHTDSYRKYYAEDDKHHLEEFRRGRLECLITCHKLSQGIDIQTLRNVVLFSSATTNLETIQRIGRCLRISPDEPDKRATVIDLVLEKEDHADVRRKKWLTDLAKHEGLLQMGLDPALEAAVKKALKENGKEYATKQLLAWLKAAGSQDLTERQMIEHLESVLAAFEDDSEN